MGMRIRNENRAFGIKWNGIPDSRSTEIIERSSNGATLADLRTTQPTASHPVNRLYQDELSITRHLLSLYLVQMRAANGAFYKAALTARHTLHHFIIISFTMCRYRHSIKSYSSLTYREIRSDGNRNSTKLQQHKLSRSYKSILRTSLKNRDGDMVENVRSRAHLYTYKMQQVATAISRRCARRGAARGKRENLTGIVIHRQRIKARGERGVVDIAISARVISIGTGRGKIALSGSVYRTNLREHVPAPAGRIRGAINLASEFSQRWSAHCQSAVSHPIMFLCSSRWKEIHRGRSSMIRESSRYMRL